MLLFTNADNAVRACVLLHQRLEKAGILIKTAIGWSEPAAANRMPDRVSLKLYYALEKSGKALPGYIILTPELYDKIADSNARQLCEPFKSATIPSFGKISVSRVA